MTDQVEEIKQKTDIVSIIGEHVDLKKAGRNFKAPCPFHSEKTPSFMVSPELQIYKCFGCGKGGDVYSFLQEYEGMDFYESLQYLANRTGVKLKITDQKSRGQKQRLFETTSTINSFYKYILLNHKSGKKALEYLKKDRGLTISTIKKFELGYSPDVNLALKKYVVDRKGYSLDEIEKAGVLYRRSGYEFDRFKGRITFPLHDHRGNVAGFSGRTTPWSRGDHAKYINTPETIVYHKSKMLYGLNFTRSDIKKKKSAIVVEGELDLISTWQTNIKNVVALKGSAFTDEQARLISRFAESVTLAFDADVAGNSAAIRGIKIAQNAGLEVYVCKIKGYKDPDEMAHKDPEALKKTISKPVGVWDYIIEQIFMRHDISKGSGKGRVSQEIVPVLRSISDSIVQAHYVSQVAKKLDVPEEVVYNQIGKMKAEKNKKNFSEQYVKTENPTRRDLLEKRLMTILFNTNRKLLESRKYKMLIKKPLTKKILDEYIKYIRKKKSFDPSDFASNLPKELVEGYIEMILKEEDHKVFEDANLEKELSMVTSELMIIDVKEKLKVSADKIKLSEKQGKKAKLKEEQKKFSKLSNKLSKLEEEVGV
jgi:DNA primase